MAGVTVFAVDAGQVEVGQRRVVQRQHGLVAVGRVGVEGPGFECLHVVAAAHLGGALKNQPTIDADRRDHERAAAGPARLRVVKAVVGRLHFELGRDKTTGAQKGAGHLRREVAALAVVGVLALVDGAGAVAGGVGLQAPVQPQRGVQGLWAVAPLQLGQAVKRRSDGRVHVLQGLPFLRPRQQVVTIAAPGQGAVAFDQALIGQAIAAGQRKVTPIVVVADAVDFPIGVQARNEGRQIGLVAPSIRPAIAFAQAVVGHVVEGEVAAEVPLQVTKFGPQIHPALAHEGGGEGGIAVGGNVPVVGQAHFKTADAVDANGGRQQAGFALVR